MIAALCLITLRLQKYSTHADAEQEIRWKLGRWWCCCVNGGGGTKAGGKEIRNVAKFLVKCELAINPRKESREFAHPTICLLLSKFLERGFRLGTKGFVR